MHVFITGGTGLIGSAVVADLLAHGHTVLGLARSEAAAHALEVAGATALRGDLDDLDVLHRGATAAEGVVHLAYGHDASSEAAVARCVAQDGAALEVLGEALVGSDRALVVVSGTPWIPGRASTEADPLPTDGVVGDRGRFVEAVLALAGRGVRSTAVRMPRTVHRGAGGDGGDGAGIGGFAGFVIGEARHTSVVAYPGDGTQRWPAVHALDAAAAFRLALESAAAGTVWHAVADEGDAVRDLAAVVGRRLGLPLEARPAEAFGPFGPLLAMDQPASSAHTRATLGWTPTQPRLLSQLETLAP